VRRLFHVLDYSGGFADRPRSLDAKPVQRILQLPPALLSSAAQINSLTGLCITKLDVLDGLETLKLATSYKYHGETIELPPLGADAIEQCEPVYEEMPGWNESTVGIKDLDSLPANARDYLNRMQEIVGVPVDIVSTGPERDQTIILNHPFG